MENTIKELKDEKSNLLKELSDTKLRLQESYQFRSEFEREFDLISGKNVTLMRKIKGNYDLKLED